MNLLSIKVRRELDDSPDLSDLGEYTDKPSETTVDRGESAVRRGEYRYFQPATEYAEQDYRRMEAYDRGDWHMIGIYAVAKIQATENGPIQTIRSGGLWGIESDSDDEYLVEVAAEQLAKLRVELLALGVTEDQLADCEVLS